MSETHCHAGHSFAVYGRYQAKDGSPNGTCRECKRLYNKHHNKKGRRKKAPQHMPKTGTGWEMPASMTLRYLDLCALAEGRPHWEREAIMARAEQLRP